MPKNGKAESEFWWASVAGAECEPVEVTTLDGQRVAYTTGCGDPFYLDRPDNPCDLIQTMSDVRPDTRATKAEKQAAYEKYQRSKKAWGMHSWRGPR